MVTKEEALAIANKLGITFDKFSFADFLTGINVELEHGLVNPYTNVTNDDLEMTVKIALAHLNELPNYYNPEYGLLQFEQFLKSKL
ncbi:MAG: hypothetical protein GX247_03645 [Mollicutes bacterium]|jgi:hypothetical protein|nr:hypothetical protein [Mollicutes bacterium]